MNQELLGILNSASIQPEVLLAHPTYTAKLILVENIQGGESDGWSSGLLDEAEKFVAQKLEHSSLEEIPEIAIWREAYASFGVKPRVGRSSVEALVRRCGNGLPRINLITDIYNYISVKHLIPIGGENFEKYDGPPQLVIATGDETFDTTEDGQAVIHHPEPGEVIWKDNAGVTCRRWNWRQCTRTRLGVETSTALFILDGLGHNSPQITETAFQELVELISSRWPEARFTSNSLSN